ncbi:MAG: AmmeMemoRadiSam system protein B [Acidobacteria bacterium]|nr:AmmeMemoRadiSam system protein B [Acidobacteriota bacterium]
MQNVRSPAVAGAFYPASAQRLSETVAGLLAPAVERVPALGVMVPHAGYVYSGGCAGATFARVEVPGRVILLGPNHTGRGVSLAAAAEDAWLTPLGKAAIDRELLDDLVAAGAGVQVDSRAHGGEHSLEVEVPFLLALRPQVRLAPVVVGTHARGALAALGRALAEVARRCEPRPLIVVSSDMTHYEPADTARAKDERALARLAALDPEGLLDVVTAERITMCGVAPAVAALFALRELGARGGELVSYTHSGMVTGDDAEVVAYAGMIFA